MSQISQLTLRHFDPRVAAEIRRLAKQMQISLNQAAQLLLKRGAGVSDPRGNPRRIGSARPLLRHPLGPGGPPGEQGARALRAGRPGSVGARRLLDTNAYVAMAKGDARVAGLIREAEEVVLSMVVVGELLYGFRHGSRRARNVELLDDFLAQPVVAVKDVTRATAEWFAEISTGLRRKGHPIPTNDVWIAAHAFETGSELITFDRHFSQVPGLLLRHPE